MKAIDSQLGINIQNSGYFNASGQSDKYSGDFATYRSKYAISAGMSSSQLKEVLDRGMTELKQWKSKTSGGDRAQRRVADRNYKALNSWLGEVNRAYAEVVKAEKSAADAPKSNPTSNLWNKLQQGLEDRKNPGENKPIGQGPDATSEGAGNSSTDNQSGIAKTWLKQDRMVLGAIGLAAVGIGFWMYKKLT